jgi:O-antigen ligase
MAFEGHGLRWSVGQDRRHGGSRVLAGRSWFDPWGLGVLATGAALVAAYALLHHSVTVAAAFCLIPLIVWLAVRPTPLLFLLGLAIPWTYSLPGASGGLNVSPSDLILTFAFVALLAQAVATGSMPAVRALRPVAVPVGQFAVLMLLLLAVHFSPHDVIKTFQRYELFVFPLVVGAFAALTGRHVILLKAYVLSATVLGVLWPLDGGLGQKNPVGQMIGNAILVLVGVRALRRFLPLVLLLTPALLLTGSRGALLATGVGLVFVLVLQDARVRVVFIRLSALALVAFATFVLLPAGRQARLTSFSSGFAPGSYAVYLRHQYANDAKRIIRQHPWVGIGVGNYQAGQPLAGTVTTDPHDVFLLVAAEGGYIFAASFVILILGCAAAVVRMHGLHIAAAAGGVFVATVLHGLVDVYWVRGTPVLAWLLVGMTCGAYLKFREGQVGSSEA